MKLFYAIIILFILSSCSFDDKTGIWKNENLTQTANEVLLMISRKYLALKIFLTQ